MSKGNKVFWSVLLFLSVIFFIAGLIKHNILYTVLALVLGIIVQKKGGDTLFKEYDEKNKKKKKEIEEIKMIYEENLKKRKEESKNDHDV